MVFSRMRNGNHFLTGIEPICPNFSILIPKFAHEGSMLISVRFCDTSLPSALQKEAARCILSALIPFIAKLERSSRVIGDALYTGAEIVAPGVADIETGSPDVFSKTVLQ